RRAGPTFNAPSTRRYRGKSPRPSASPCKMDWWFGHDCSRSSIMPRRSLTFVLTLLALAVCATPDLTAAEKAVPYAMVLGPIRLWEGDAPGALGQRPQDIPTLTPYPAAADKKTGATMLIFPGGGYGHL